MTVIRPSPIRGPIRDSPIYRATVGKWGAVTPADPGETPADYIVTNDSEWATANTNATAGQIIELADSGTFTDLTMTNNTGVTVRGETAGVPVVRSFYANAVGAATIKDFSVQPNATPSGGPKLFAMAGNCDGLVVDNLTIHGGDWLNSFADIDPTVTDASRMGSNAGWGSSNSYASDMWYGIGSGAAGVLSGSITIQNCTVSDVRESMKFSWYGGGTLRILNNTMIRPYQDYISVGLPAAAGSMTGMEICGNVGWDEFAQPQDNLNPHGDFIQLFTSDNPVSPYEYVLPGVLIAGNVLFYTPGARGQPQRIFASDIMDEYPFIAPIVVENLLISRITSKGITMASDDNGPPGTGAVWGYIYRNTVLSNPSNNAPIQNELYTNTTSGIPAASSTSKADLEVRNDDAYSTSAMNFVGRNFFESVTSHATLNQALANIVTDRGSNATSYATWFDPATDGAWNALADGDDYVTAFTPKSGYADYGAVRSGDTLQSLTERWGIAANRPWSSLPSWVGWADRSGVTASGVETSEWCFVHAGGSGSTRSISISGGEYQVADDKDGTGAGSWLTSSGTIAHGKFLRIRQTASSSDLTETTASVTIGSDTLNWVVETASTAVYPVVAFTKAEPDSYARGIGGLGSDGQVGTLALLQFKMASAPASSVNLFSSASATRFSVQILTTGKLRVTFYNSAASQFARAETSAVICDGTYKDILVSWDTSQASNAAGVSVYTNGLSDQNTAAMWATDTCNYSGATATYTFGGTSAPGSAANFEGEIAAFYLNIAARVDITNSANRAKFDASAIGTGGSGVTGSAPVVFLVGNAAQWNDAGGINRGSGSKYIKVGSAAVTDVSGSAWS